MVEHKGFIYLATPYDKYPGGKIAAHENACLAAAFLIKNGASVFCPIAQSHPISEHGKVPPRDHDLWLTQDRPMMDAAARLVVVKMKGWAASVGIAYEIKVFEEAGKPITYMEWSDQ